MSANNKDIKIGLSLLDDYENNFEKHLESIFVLKNPLDIEDRYGLSSPFIRDMNGILYSAQKKLEGYPEGMARYYFLKGRHEAVLSFSGKNARKRKSVEYYLKALENGFVPKSYVYYRIGGTLEILGGKVMKLDPITKKVKRWMALTLNMEWRAQKNWKPGLPEVDVLLRQQCMALTILRKY